VAEDLECPYIILAAGAVESVRGRTDRDPDETDLGEHLVPACARQATGNSRRPKINVAGRRLGGPRAIDDVGELKVAAWEQDAEDFREDPALIGA